MRLDRFDLVNIVAAAAFLVAGLGIAASGGGENEAVRPAVSRTQAAPPPPSYYAGLDRARALFDAGQFGQSVSALGKLASEFPAQPDIHALMGQAYSSLNDYPSAMKEYRTALQMEPEYVDKKSGRFIGKRIKATVKEGMALAKAGLAKDKDDAASRAALSDAYYLERMLAGGCE
jgi:tetratricopeptide (TPR) repeat protein